MMGILRESLFLPLYHFGMLSLSALKSISELVSPALFQISSKVDTQENA